jgi:hypothetical protein
MSTYFLKIKNLDTYNNFKLMNTFFRHKMQEMSTRPLEYCDRGLESH